MTRRGRDRPGGAPARTSAPRWSEWRGLPTAWSPSADVLRETLDGGQSFRWHHDGAGSWTGTWAGCVAQLRLGIEGLEWRAPLVVAARTEAELPRYLALDDDWAARADALPLRVDEHLAACVREFGGLRLLRQPFGEVLLGFLCSSSKRIVQIKQMLGMLAERHGAEIAPGHSRLPTWPELAGVSEAELRLCRLGFRARYVRDTAQFLASQPDWLGRVERLPYADAKAALLDLPGVGEKVADCVLLFGAGRAEAFPVDTWILKSLARRYRLDGWKPAQLAAFGRKHFGPGAGLAQQYLFAWERRFGGR